MISLTGRMLKKMIQINLNRNRPPDIRQNIGKCHTSWIKKDEKELVHLSLEEDTDQFMQRFWTHEELIVSKEENGWSIISGEDYAKKLEMWQGLPLQDFIEHSQKLRCSKCRWGFWAEEARFLIIQLMIGSEVLLLHNNDGFFRYWVCLTTNQGAMT